MGEAGLYADGRGGYHPFPSEGGHVDFAPRNDLEMELLRYLMGRFEHVSYERVLSGPGLHNIYQFLRETGRARSPPGWPSRSRRAIHRPRFQNRRWKELPPFAFRLWIFSCRCMAPKPATWRLKMLATGGMYVGGGIAPKIIRKLSSTAFMKSFSAKGRIGGVLKDIPVRVITNDKTALLGAGRVAALSLNNAAQARELKLHFHAELDLARCFIERRHRRKSGRIPLPAVSGHAELRVVQLSIGIAQVGVVQHVVGVGANPKLASFAQPAQRKRRAPAKDPSCKILAR